jgi:outer membrane protein assembly factor BamB
LYGDDGRRGARAANAGGDDVTRTTFSIRRRALCLFLLGTMGTVAGSAVGRAAPDTQAIGFGEQEVAPATSEPSEGVSSATDLDAMLLTADDVEGHTPLPHIVAEGAWRRELHTSEVCPDGGSVLLFDGEAQAYTLLDNDAITIVEQFLAAGAEQQQRRRFAGAAEALDSCDGVSIDLDDGTVAITRVEDVSLPEDARIFEQLFIHESGWDKPYHVVYARVGPVLTVLSFNGIERHEVLTIVHRALSKIAVATGSPGPPAAVGPPAPPEGAAIPEGFVEHAVPELIESPATDCVTIPPAAPAPPPPLAALPSLPPPDSPLWVAEAEEGFYDPMVAHDGVLYLMDGTSLVALRAKDGSTAWRVDPGLQPVFLAGGESLFVAGQAEGLVTLAALDSTYGEQQWATAVRFGANVWGLDATEDSVYLHLMPDELDGPSSGETWVFDADTGALRWRVDGPDAAAASGTVLIGVGNGCGVTAFDAVTGAATWTIGLDTFHTSVAVVNDRLFALRDQQLMSLDPDSGAINWVEQLPGEVARTGWAGDGRHLYVVQVGMGQSPVGITVFESETGLEVWSVRVEPPSVEATITRVATSSIHVEGGVITIATGTHVIRLDAATGTVLSIDDMLDAIDGLEPDNRTSAAVVLLGGAAVTVGEDHVVRIS